MYKRCKLAGLKYLENNEVEVVCEYDVYNTTTFDELQDMFTAMRCDYDVDEVRTMWYTNEYECSAGNFFNREKFKIS